MKKLMIAAAIVCAAALSQAATVYWSFGTIYDAGAGGTGWSATGLSGDTQVQLIVGSTLTDGVIGNTVYSGTTDVTFDSGFQWPEALNIAAMADDTPYYSQLIITKGDSTLTSGIFSLTSASLADSTVSPNWGIGNESMNIGDANSGTGLTGLSTFNSTYGAFSAAGWQTSAEPTSGLLLLLGVAGLALRRRRA